MGHHRHHQRHRRYSVSAPVDDRAMHDHPRPAYLTSLEIPSQTVPIVAPKTHLLITDLDETLLHVLSHCPEGGVKGRPYLHSFISYMLHPQSPFALGVWTFAGRCYGIAHLRSLGLGRLFADGDLSAPHLSPSVLSFFGFEDSGLTEKQMDDGHRPHVKDLNLVWDMLNDQRESGAPVWSAANSFLMDDQVQNAGAQPFNIMRAPVFTDRTEPGSFLLQMIGLLDELAHETNFANKFRENGWNSKGIRARDEERYAQKGMEVCQRMDIKVSESVGRADLKHLKNLPSTRVGPPDDSIRPLTDSRGRVSIESLRGCCQDPPHPAAVIERGPDRIAIGMPTGPSSEYVKKASIPTRKRSQDGRPLIVLDLDGTLYARPPCNLNPLGDAVPRPYLKLFLTWLLRPESPWSVAIWTSSHLSTAVRCLSTLDLGLVGPHLLGPKKDTAELLHTRLVALWAREDLGLVREDRNAYVAIVKDLDRLWDYLRASSIGSWSSADTIMIDDTAAKLLAQPFNLINPPTFHYPLSPAKDFEDTFLIQLVAMLGDLVGQSNFSNFVAGKGWNVVQEVFRRAEGNVEKGAKMLAETMQDGSGDASATQTHRSYHQRRRASTKV